MLENKKAPCIRYIGLNFGGKPPILILCLKTIPYSD
jgi:hypothetical protein